ncbi:MAG TPA: tRNA lysidine(34) synthetase TilS, partial [Ktedonobacteraceae bacterium]|nr:tRNA lysidine(34) synthetase TilS [Ktedonobacteraceae bacterium]
LASAWGLPVTIGEIDVPALAREERRSLEDAARTARYRFLREVAQGQPIAVGHHAGDQVETLLLHWLRGSGLEGMVGMLPRQQDIIRPLLEVSHAETLAYCQEHGLVPLEDTSNSDPRFLRNRIRHELLPLLESLNPRIRSALLRNAEVVRVDAEWIREQVDNAWPAVVISEGEDSIKLNVSALVALPLSLQRHLVRRVTAQLCAGQSPLELRHYLLIEQLLRREHHSTDTVTAKLHLPGQLQVSRDLNEVVFERLSNEVQLATFSVADTEILLPIPGRIGVKGTPWVASAEIVAGERLQEVRQALLHEDWPEVWRLLPSTRHIVYIDGDRVDSFLWVRTRRPGDRIRPLGMAHEKKVQDVLVDAHISRAERASIPLFFSASHCVWLAGVHIDDRVRLTSRTQRILRLAIEPGS